MSTPAVAGARTNVLAIVSLVTSILGFGLVGVITGHIGLNQIKKTGEEGRGLAIAGLIIGYIQIAAVVLFIALGGLSLLAIAASQGSVS
jgi:hypothetical protein